MIFPLLGFFICRFLQSSFLASSPPVFSDFGIFSFFWCAVTPFLNDLLFLDWLRLAHFRV